MPAVHHGFSRRSHRAARRARGARSRRSDNDRRAAGPASDSMNPRPRAASHSAPRRTAGDFGAVDTLRIAPARHIRRDGIECRRFGEHIALCRHVDVVQRRERGRPVLPARSAARRADPDRRTGSGRSSTPFTTVKTAVLAPIPSASVRMAMTAKPGCRRSMRSAYRTSCHNAPTSCLLDGV